MTHNYWIWRKNVDVGKGSLCLPGLMWTQRWPRGASSVRLLVPSLLSWDHRAGGWWAGLQTLRSCFTFFGVGCFVYYYYYYFLLLRRPQHIQTQLTLLCFQLRACESDKRALWLAPADPRLPDVARFGAAAWGEKKNMHSISRIFGVRVYNVDNKKYTITPHNDTIGSLFQREN